MYLIQTDDIGPALAIAMKANLPPVFVGPPGTGKTESTCGFASKAKLPMRITQWATKGPEDAEGIPVPDLDAGICRWLRPSDFPTVDRDGERGVWLHDELDRCQQEVQNALTRLFLEGCIGEYRKPDGWLLAGTMNGSTDEYTTPLSEAFRQRCAFFYVMPSRQGWSDHADANGVLPDMRDFVVSEWSTFMQRWQPEDLAAGFVSYARSATQCSGLVKALRSISSTKPEVLRLESAIVQSKLGYEGAVRWMTRRAKRVFGSFQAILTAPTTAPVPGDIPGQIEASSLLLAAPALHSDRNSMLGAANSIALYLGRMATEVAAFAVRSLVRNHPDCATLQTVMDLMNRS